MPSQSDNSKLDDYLSAEAFRQSPSERLRTKLGFNDYDNSKFQDVYAEAQRSTKSVVKCEWCGDPALSANVRAETKLCSKCSPGRRAIEGYKRHYKVHNLSDADRQAIANSPTTRYGK